MERGGGGKGKEMNHLFEFFFHDVFSLTPIVCILI